MIRLANYSDIDITFDFGKKFYDTLTYNIVIDETKGKDFIRFVIDSNDGLALIIEANDNLPVGCLLAFCQEHPFASCKIASELIWWVEPDYRGRKDSLKLFEAYEYWAARRMGAEIISAVATPGDEKLARYYERKKYIPKEITHMRTF